MSSEFSFSWLNQMLKNSGESSINSAQYARIFQEANSKDGEEVDEIITFEEFCTAAESVLTQSQITAIENEYSDAFNALANYDGEEGISLQEDLTAQSENEKGIADRNIQTAAEKMTASNSENNYANSEEYKNRANKTPIALSSGTTPTVEAIKANDIMNQGKDVNTLRQERSDISNQIEMQRTEMEAAKAEKQEAVDTAEDAYQTRLNSYAEAISSKEEELSQTEQQYVELKADRDEKNTQINDQKSVITDLKSGVDSQKTAISSIDNQLANHLAQEPQRSSFTKEVKNEDGEIEKVEDKDAFDQEHEKWVQQKNTLEEQKREAEDKLSEYEQQLGEAENALKVLEQELEEIDSQINNMQESLIKGLEEDLITNGSLEAQEPSLEVLKSNLDNAKNALENVTAPFEANIAQLQQNLAEYDTAISQAENSIEPTDGMERLGEYTNTYLDATRAGTDDILSSNSVTLEEDEQEEYLKEYLGEGNFGEVIQEGSNYYTKVNDDGTTDCFKVVNDHGEVKIIHTNIPNTGDPTTEVFGVDPLKDENGEERTYSVYATSKEGVLLDDQIQKLADEITQDGKIPDDFDLSSLSAYGLSSLIEKYGDGEKFANEFLADMDSEYLENIIKDLKQIIGARARREISTPQTEAALDNLRLKSGEIISQNGNEYLDRIETLDQDIFGITDEDKNGLYQEIVDEILSDNELHPEEITTLLKKIAENDNANVTFNTRSDGFIELLNQTYNGNNLDDVLELASWFTEKGEEQIFPNDTSNHRDTTQANYIELISSLYENATSQEEINRINETFSDFPSILQERYMFGEETTKINNLFNSIYNAATKDESNKYKTDSAVEEIWEQKYGSPGSDTFFDVLEDYEAGNPNDYISALMWACEGDLNNFTNYFRDVSSYNQKKYLPIILEAFGGSWKEE